MPTGPFGTRVANTILASGSAQPPYKAEHTIAIASTLPLQMFLQSRGRPHTRSGKMLKSPTHYRLHCQPKRLSENGATGRLVERPVSISTVKRESTGARV